MKPLVNVLQGNPPTYPLIAMHSYSLDRLLHILQACCGDEVFMRLTDHGGHEGVFVFFRKRGSGSTGRWTGE